jgi:hypothetical protein
MRLAKKAEESASPAAGQRKVPLLEKMNVPFLLPELPGGLPHRSRNTQGRTTRELERGGFIGLQVRIIAEHAA